MSTTRRRLLDNTFKKSVVGNPAVAQGSLARRGPGITMKGWTEQDNTTGAQLFDASKIPSKTQSGATLTNNDDGSFTITGEGQLTSSFSNSAAISGDEARKLLRAGTLRTNMAGNVPKFYVYAYDSDHEVLFTTANTGESELTDEILGEINLFYYVFYSPQGSVITPGIVWPMAYQDGYGTWEPYTGGQPSPSPDYPQEIVSSGSWDETAQKWEYEIEISNAEQNPTEIQTVTLTADRPLTKWDRLTKKDGQWGWEYKSAEIVLDGSEDESWIYYAPLSTSESSVFYIKIPGLVEKQHSYNTEFGFIDNRQEGFMLVGAESNYFLSILASRISTQDVAGLKKWLSENPMTVIYKTTEETFTPLTASEQEAMNALYTYRPTTVLSNQQDCEMALTYKTRKSMEVTT